MSFCDVANKIGPIVYETNPGDNAKKQISQYNNLGVTFCKWKVPQ